MNRKQFIILLVLVAVVGAAGWLVHQRNQQSWQNSGQSIGQKLLPDLPVNEIAHITIKAGTNELNLAKRDNVWRVAERANYPANFSQISELFMKFADLKTAQTEEIGASQLGRFELLPAGAGANTATQIEFKEAGGKVRNLVLLGKKHLHKSTGGAQFPGMGDEGWPDGRYVMVGSGAKSYAVVTDPLENVQPKADAWLNKDFIQIEKPRSIAVEFSAATNSWKLERAAETNDWVLVDAKSGELLDAAKISSVTSPFSAASFNDVAAGPTNTFGHIAMLKVETFEGFDYTIQLGEKQADNYPLTLSIAANLSAERVAAKDEKPEDKARLDKEFNDRKKTLAEKLARQKAFTGWVYEVPSYAIDSFLKHRSELLVEVQKETGTNAPVVK